MVSAIMLLKEQKYCFQARGNNRKDNKWVEDSQFYFNGKDYPEALS